MSEAQNFQYSGDKACRLDRVLLEYFESSVSSIKITRSQLKNLIESGSVSVNKKLVTKAGALVQPLANIEIELSSLHSSDLLPYEFKLDVVYEDQNLIVINKPQGISMHPGAGERSRTIANALISYLGKSASLLPERAGVVHRLDKDTTGLVVLAKDAATLAALSKQFSLRTVKRRYKALVLSTPRSKREVNIRDSGVVDAPIGRDPVKRIKMKIDGLASRKALTEWQVIERMQYASYLNITLKTGRTHQIRVHMASLKSPVIGDLTYGDMSALPSKLKLAADSFGRQALHADTLGFLHPISEKELVFERAIPQDFEDLLVKFRAV